MYSTLWGHCLDHSAVSYRFACFVALGPTPNESGDAACTPPAPIPPLVTIGLPSIYILFHANAAQI